MSQISDQEAKNLMQVLEVDQWTSTGGLVGKTLLQLIEEGVCGGDSEAAKKLGIASFSIKEVNLFDKPSIGKVWFGFDKEDRLYKYKTNYDSSD